MKKLLAFLLVALIILVIDFFTFAPSIFEKQTNKIDGKPLPKITVEAQKLHGSLMIVDIARSSHKALADILKLARRPVVSSHRR